MIAQVGRWLGVLGLCCFILATNSSTIHAAGNTWYVTTASDDPNDGNLGSRSGSLRFTLTNAVSGDFVSFAHYDVVVGIIYVASPLVIPAGVAVGHLRTEACGRYTAPLVNVQALDTTVNPVFSVGGGSTLRDIDIGGGYSSVRVTGANADVCAVGMGIEVDGGIINTLPALSSALVVDGAHAVIHQNYINGSIVVSTNGSDSRIGDIINGNGDNNAGVRDAYVTVLADSTTAAQRVTIRDPFPRGLFGLVGMGVAGGDDVVNHANNWVQTPTILSAYTFDNFVTVHVLGTANPLSQVDIYFDNQVTVARQSPVMADAQGNFSFNGALPGSNVIVLAASTLADSAHLNRLGSSSQFSRPVQVTIGNGSTPTPTPIPPNVSSLYLPLVER